MNTPDDSRALASWDNDRIDLRPVFLPDDPVCWECGEFDEECSCPRPFPSEE